MKLWGGRFEKATDGLVDDFHSSISFDQRLFEQDITGSIAHATMLGEQGIIPQADADKIVAGLKDILADAKAGKIEWMVDAEDIHMNVETLLTQRIGEAGKRLHTGRSRNDQVALDTRMYAKAACRETEAMLEDLLEAIVGNIYDEFDPKEEPEITQLSEGRWRVSGSAELETVAEALDIDLPTDEEFDTLGGLIFSRLTEIPADGERPVVECFGLRISVETIADRRVEWAIVEVLQESAAEETEESKETK